MTKLQWTDALSVGIEQIDCQHKQWIAHFNAAVDAMGAKLGTDHIIKDLGFLVDYTETHFAAEEGYMTAAKYPATWPSTRNCATPWPTSSGTSRRKAPANPSATPSVPCSATG